MTGGTALRGESSDAGISKQESTATAILTVPTTPNKMQHIMLRGYVRALALSPSLMFILSEPDPESL